MRKPDKLCSMALAIGRNLAIAVACLRTGRPVEAGMAIERARSLKWKIPQESRCRMRVWILIDAVESAGVGLMDADLQ
jgi:hypothetical protein